MKLEDSTPVILRTKQDLSSVTANVGDRVPFRVTEDVKVGDLIAIRRGADAWGMVTAVQRTRRKGRAGSVDVAIQSVQLLTGVEAPLRAEEHSQGAGKKAEIGLVMTQLSLTGIGLPLAPLFLLQKGGDAYLPADTKVITYLNSDVPLDRGALERLQPLPTKLRGPATVTIFRTRKWGTAYRPSVYCGSVALARLPDGSYLKIQLRPGNYFFQSNDNQVLELNLQEGQEIYLQMQMLTHGLSMKGHLVQVANSDGEDEITGLRQLSEKDVVKASEANLAEFQAHPEVK
jgi:hypothetical protein